MFCTQCGNSVKLGDKVCNKCGAVIEAQTHPSINKSTKSPAAALILCLLLGVIGVHRFYVGKIGTGVLMVLTLGGLGIWYLVDLIFIVTNNFEDKQGNTLELTTNPSPAKK